MKNQANKKQIRFQRKKEKYQKAIALKPKLLREILKSCIAAIIVMALLCVWLSNYFADKYSYYANYLLTSEVDNVNSKMAKEMARKDAPLSIGDISWIVDYPNFDYLYPFIEYYNYFLLLVKHNDSLEYSSYKVLYDLDGNVISDNSMDAYQLIVTGSHDDQDRKIYKCLIDFDSIDNTYPGLSADIKNSFLEHYSIAPLDNVRVDMDDIYYNDNYFIPSKLSINLVDYVENNLYQDDIDNAPIIETLVSYDLSGCNFENMTKVDKDDANTKVFSLITIGSVQANHSRMFYESFDKEQTLSLIKDVSERKTGYSQIYSNTNSRLRAVRFAPTSDGDAVVAVYVDLDFFRDYSDALLIIYIASFVLAIIIGLVIGFIRYGKKLVPYEIDSYRRNTTNSMAHDLKTPLMAISGYAENILKENNPNINHASAENILESVKYMDQMIANILELSKLENNNNELKIVDIDVRELVNKCLNKYQPVLEKKKMTTKLSGDSSIKSDTYLLERLIDNLLSNASKYGSSDSDIAIVMSETGITVSNKYDNKITTKTTELFKPFVKGDNARGNVEGNGLGLSIVQEIATALGMTVSLDTSDNTFIAHVNYK